MVLQSAFFGCFVVRMMFMVFSGFMRGFFSVLVEVVLGLSGLLGFMSVYQVYQVLLWSGAG